MKETANYIASPAKTAPAPTLFQVYKKLGERNRAAKTVVERLAAKGTIVAQSTVYNVIYGRSGRADITEEFLTVAAEMLAQAKDLQARTAALIS